ncbi:MAG: hypothetical protein CM15mV127_170 [Caudoviricetes sp.]|nr:MAG: hypothetical protein CM15mV127_170 [Caudoviricetes sp.]
MNKRLHTNAKFWNKDKEWYDVFTAAPIKKFYILKYVSGGEN